MTIEQANDIDKDGGASAKVESKNIIPTQYQKLETTPLTFTIKTGKNTYEFDIPEEFLKADFPAWSKYEAQKKK
jgi:hypothetical protein